MANPFSSVEIEWGGVAYRVTPTNRLLCQIEGGPRGINVLSMIRDASAGAPKLSQFAYVMAELLRAAGAEVTEDEAFQALAHGPTFDLIGALVMALVPDMPAKKPTRPASLWRRLIGRACLPQAATSRLPRVSSGQ